MCEYWVIVTNSDRIELERNAMSGPCECQEEKYQDKFEALKQDIRNRYPKAEIELRYKGELGTG